MSVESVDHDQDMKTEINTVFHLFALFQPPGVLSPDGSPYLLLASPQHCCSSIRRGDGKRKFSAAMPRLVHDSRRYLRSTQSRIMLLLVSRTVRSTFFPISDSVDYPYRSAEPSAQTPGLGGVWSCVWVGPGYDHVFYLRIS